LNRTGIAEQTDSIRLSSNLLSPGNNTLTFFLIDTTSFVRSLTHPAIHLKKVIWNIKYQPSAVEYEVFTSQATLSVYPNPASGTINLTYHTNLPSDEEFLVRLLDSSGKSVIRSFSIQPSEQHNEYTIPLPGRQLASGLYYLQLQSSGHVYKLPVVISGNSF